MAIALRELQTTHQAYDVLARARARLETCDAYDRYWLSEVLSEIAGAHDMSYRRELAQHLTRMIDGEMVLLLRCRACTRYYAQPVTVRWQTYCSGRCADRARHTKEAQRA